MSATSPRSLERYDLVERVAIGGMAEVFLAKAYGAHGFEKTLAVKRILPELAASREFEERFISEAKLAVTLTHANIVQVFDFGRIDDVLFLAMEYVDGVDLAALLSFLAGQDERLPLPAAFQIAIELLRGLDYAHQHGVVHRDVSPSNILLSWAGEVKIADFGIALADTEELASATHRHRIMGKWRYMSPEQTRAERLDTRSDLFAAAAVLYELFLGDKLFPGSEVEEIVASVQTMAIPRASERRAELPAALDDLLAGALARDPRDRPARAVAMQRALTEICYQSKIMASSFAVTEVVSRLARARAGKPGQPGEAGNGAGGPRKRALDDLIRQQLLPRGDAHRRTAVAGDPDGHEASDEVNELDELEHQTLREEGTPERLAVDDLPGELSSAAAGEHKPTTIVRTGIGADGVTVWSREDRAGSAPVRRTRGILAVVAGAAGILVVSGLLFWLWPATVPALAEKSPDAAPPGPTVVEHEPGILLLDSTPSHAQVWLDGERLDITTPTSLGVAANTSHRIEVWLTGHAPGVRDDLRVAPGATETVYIELAAMPASLDVRTDPPGATIEIGDHSYGSTPFLVENLAPGTAISITLSKPGYETRVRKLDLPPGGRVVVRETLVRVRPQPVRYGYVDLHVVDSWAEVYERKVRIAQAPVKQLRLPVGSHRLRLYNPVSQKAAEIVVNVVEGETAYYSTALK